MTSYSPLYPPPSEGIVCSLADWIRSANNTSPDIHCLTRGDTIGMMMNLVTACISLAAVVVVFFLILRNYVQYLMNPPPTQLEWYLIQQPMDIYMLSLFTANLLQAIGTVLDVKWIAEGKSQVGSYCSAQGIVQQLGETGTALNTFAIAIYTFFAVWACIGTHSLKAAYSAVALIWTFVIMYTFIAWSVHRRHSYETPSPYWCWIGEKYMKEKITGEYMWFWLTLATSLIVYVLLYLLCNGDIIVDQKEWWKFRFSHNKHKGGSVQGFPLILLYPVAYCTIVLPLSIVRWIQFVQEGQGNNKGMPAGWTFAVNSFFELSGVVDVALFFATRTGLLLFSGPGHVGLEGLELESTEPLAPAPRMSPALVIGLPLAELEAGAAGEQGASTLVRRSILQMEPGEDHSGSFPVEARLADDDGGWDPELA